jgi:4-nitrophenyl phosphatase
MTFPILCDLDGVIWLSHQPIPGAADAVARFRAAGHRVVFVTNNSFSLLAEHEAALAAIGIPAEGDVLTSAMAAAQLVTPGERVMLAAGRGVREAFEARGIEIVEDGSADTVVVGLHRDFDYAGLTRASSAIRNGARFIGTNTDSTFPTAHGLVPGAGSLIAAVATAAGVEPIVAGKPHQPMAMLAHALLGEDLSAAVMVGDRLDTDGEFAGTLGCRFALVYTGVVRPGTVVEPRPAFVSADLAALADELGV